VNTAANVAISGQDLDETLRSQLLAAAAGVIGEVGAHEIGSAYTDAIKDGVDPAEYLVHKIAHAALGCATGAVGGGGCASGAVGGAMGEVISGIYARPEAVHALEADLNAQIKTGQISQDEAISLVMKWRDEGVDIARLGSALSAFVAGVDVNTAANAGSNAAENNGLEAVIPLTPIAAEAAAAAGHVTFRPR